jgi:hypothetical protein
VGEITSGFLVLCVPSAPKAFKDSIFARKVTTFADRLGGNFKSNDLSNSRQGLPSWHRPNTPRRLQRSGFSEIEEIQAPAVQPQNCMRYGALPRDDQGTHGLGVVLEEAVHRDYQRFV